MKDWKYMKVKWDDSSKYKAFSAFYINLNTDSTKKTKLMLQLLLIWQGQPIRNKQRKLFQRSSI